MGKIKSGRDDPIDYFWKVPRIPGKIAVFFSYVMRLLSLGDVTFICYIWALVLCVGCLLRMIDLVCL